MWFLQVFNSLTYLSMKVRVIVFVSQFRSVHSVVSDSLWRHGLQHTRLPCPSPTPRAYSDWVGYAIQPSHPLMSPSPPALNLSQHQGLFQWVILASGGQSIGVSVSASVLQVNIQGWFSLGLTSLISLQSKGLSRVFSSTTVQKH